MGTEIYIPSDQLNRGRDRKRRKKSRWSAADNYMPTTSLSAIPRYIPIGLTVEQQEALAVRVRIEEITKKLNLNDLDIDYSSDRSPSPEPVYDKEGKRVNTRDQRAKERLTIERHNLVLLATQMQPQFRPPADYQPVNIKKTRKIMIPVEKYPDYNFIGLIIGPRGNTQKRMERETGTKISIRGRGSVKDGKGKKNNPGDDEPLHVFLTADTEGQLDKAAKAIYDLLVPLEEGKNEHKRQQLIELAMINGTLRDRMWMQPPADEASFTKADVKCAICGDSSHPTSDCSLRGKGGIPGFVVPKKSQIDNEYMKFLSEIGEETPDGGNPTNNDRKDPDELYKEFMDAIGESSTTGNHHNSANHAAAANPSSGGYPPSGSIPQIPPTGGMHHPPPMAAAAPWSAVPTPPPGMGGVPPPPYGAAYPGVPVPGAWGVDPATGMPYGAPAAPYYGYPPQMGGYPNWQYSQPPQ